jgi:hypothetical protein
MRKSVVGEIVILWEFGEAKAKATSMKSPTHNVGSGSGKDPSKAAMKEVERRLGDRQHFVGEAQVVEISSGRILSGRTSDLAISGCYFDCLDSFALGTLVRTRIKKGEMVVEVEGNVVHHLPGLGMGITFRDVSPENLSALERWVAQIPIEPGPPEARAVPVNPVQTAVLQQAGGQFVELVRILVKKGILTEFEASGLLKASADE